jgi:hypothetical protein
MGIALCCGLREPADPGMKHGASSPSQSTSISLDSSNSSEEEDEYTYFDWMAEFTGSRLEILGKST